MTFKHLALSIMLGAAMTACGNCNNASQNKDSASAEATGSSASAVLITPDKTLPTIIDFNATWCGPCQRFAPIFEETAKELQGKAIFLSIDVDKSPEAAQQFAVTSIPQISVLMPDGTVTSTIGFMEKAQFIEFISPFLSK